VAVDKVGITLTFGFMPRWVLKMTGADRLTRIQTMWLHGSTLIARMVMFSAGVLVWFNARDSASSLSEFGLMLMFACGAGLLLESGNPLVKANCYYLVSAFLNEPHLRGKAYAALLNKFRGGVYRAADSNLLVPYAVLSTTYIILIIFIVGWMLAKFALGDLALGGSGILVTLGFVAFMIWRNYAGLKKFGETYERQVQFDRWRNRTLPVGAVDGEATVRRSSYWNRALLVCLVLALFIPYPYEPGGAFLIYPAQRQVVSTDTSGLVEAVYFDGGEAVKAGTVIARLSQSDIAAQVKVLNAQIEEQKATITNLKTLPRPQEVKLAEQKLEVDRTREQFSRERAPRLEKLYKVGAVSLEEYDSARKDHLTDVDQVLQREAELALVKAPVTVSQIDAAEAKLAALVEERDSYANKIERGVLRMPFDGNILSLHLKDKINSYLEKGAPFASLEFTGVVTAEIDIPESDVQYVKLGSSVRARPVSLVDQMEFTGKVTLIDRNVTQKSTGNVIKVIATIDNPEGLLKTGMAGRAKVVGTTMPVWQAFTLAITRFFKIQVWSWLP
jgi:putative peptide zinc metalloprotease protein